MSIGQGIGKLVFDTSRLSVHLAVVQDADFLRTLWIDPRVMRNVGFPQGLRITMSEIEADIIQRADSEFEQLLIVRIKATEEAVGQSMMTLPNEDGVSETDVKLLPIYWGQRFGSELKQGLVDYLFMNTDCHLVQATPNIGNLPSIRMQESVGGIRVGKGLYEFPEPMRSCTTPVHHYIYQVSREKWQQLKAKERAKRHFE